MLIVAYHSIDPSGSPVSTSPSEFEEDLRAVEAGGFSFTSLDRCAEALARDDPPPAPAVAITFDDGYASVLSMALPILRKHRVRATVFVIAGRFGADNRWDGQWESIPTMSLLSEEEVCELAAREIDIGCHGWSHRDLRDLDDRSLEREMLNAASAIEHCVGKPVRHFAYPYGYRSPREIGMASRRFATASSAMPGLVVRRSNVHDLPRLDPRDLRGALTLGLRSASSLAPYLLARRRLRQLRRSIERAWS